MEQFKRHANHWLYGMQPDQVYVPGWSGNGGINDRFAMLHPHSAATWRHRLPYTLKHCLEAPIHSESFTRDFAKHEQLEVRPRQWFPHR